MRKIELLSPAKNVEIGIQAINHGADAVYIGAPQFSARAAAGNSVTEIEQLANYAHKFGAKTFVALNTILNNSELPAAEKLIHQLYNAGADALIIQDMGILQLDLPPIDLHASTQTNNQTPEKVQFLQNVGFKRVVLARELSIPEISTIYATANVELEAFVHGSLCVSYSGLCYASQALCGRSANRGVCAQICRLPYDLLDADKKVLVQNKHLLSLKDMDRSNALLDMIEAGVSSLKIEGRLKDMAYVKNIVSYYRQKIDAVLEGKDEYERASYGKSYHTFEPNPHKTFRRGATHYFLYERQSEMIQPETPKSLGEFIGRVEGQDKNSIVISTQKTLVNGDGLCYIDSKHNFGGFKANIVDDGCKVIPAQTSLELEQGARIYRNFDHEFDKRMQQKTAERKLPLDLVFSETSTGFELSATQSGLGKHATVNCLVEKQLAQKPDAVMHNIRTQLSKFGNTLYEVNELKLNISQAWFLPASVLNELRRNVIDALDAQPVLASKTASSTNETRTTLDGIPTDYTANVYNDMARKFYMNHGAEHIDSAYEQEAKSDIPIMTSKYCLRYELGYCSKYNAKGKKVKTPLYLRNESQELRLHFDCKNCRMEIYLNS